MGPEATLEATSETDRRILDIVKELSHHLGIPGPNPNGVVWTEFLLPRRRIQDLPHAECRFTRWKVLLPSALEGRLPPEEYRPLLASGLVFSKKLRWRRLETALVGSLPALGFFTLVFFLVWYFSGYEISLGGDRASALLSLLFFTGLAWLWNVIALYHERVEPQFVSLPMYIRRVKKARLEADRKAAELVGKRSFLDVLTKVQELYPKDAQLEASKAFSSLYSSIPSIQERIRNLEPPQKHP